MQSPISIVYLLLNVLEIGTYYIAISIYVIEIIEYAILTENYIFKQTVVYMYIEMIIKKNRLNLHNMLCL